VRQALTTPELRRAKATRDDFLLRLRRPITVVLDGVSQNYNIGAIFRLCDAFLVQRLVICGTKVKLHKRKLVQAAQGTQHWVPWSERQHASEAVADAKARGAWVLVAEQTTASVRPEELVPVFPAMLVLGGERSGISLEALEAADAASVKRPSERRQPGQAQLPKRTVSDIVLTRTAWKPAFTNRSFSRALHSLYPITV
jgi:tRNA (guanosine-2'-O-)-methyltransferase